MSHKRYFRRLVPIAAACAQLVFAPAASALILNPSSGFGAGTHIDGRITQDGALVTDFDRDAGGNGIVSAIDSQTINNVSRPGSETTAARADAAGGILGGTVSGSGFVPIDSGGGGRGRAFAEAYNTYTLVGPSGVTPTIFLSWSLVGSFSERTPAINRGITTLGIVLRGAEPNSAGVPLALLVNDGASSSGSITVSDSGLVDVSQAFATAGQGALTAGRSFILDAQLTVDGIIDSLIPGGAFSADFGGTAGFSLSSSDPRITISAATPAQTAPEPSALLLVGSGLVGLAAFSRRRRT